MKLNIEQKRKLFNIRERLTAVLYPRVCPLCGRILKKVMIKAGQYDKNQKEIPDPFICPDCLGKMDFAEHRARCMRCSKPIDNEYEEYCSDCRKRFSYFEQGAALLVHDENARKAIHGLKYENMKDNADFLAFEMAEKYGTLIMSMKADAIIPVPLHKKREHERGYNQALVLANKLVFFMELMGFDPPPVDPWALSRIKYTKRLKEVQGSQRDSSLTDAFFAQEGLGYKRVLLVDDIFTTGATVNECAKTLRGAGVSMIYFLTCSIGN